MGRQHKYFREQRYKQKLENRVTNSDYFDRVYFLTKEPDPRHEREYQILPYYKGEKKVPGRNYYRYWDRPEVEYTILEFHSPRRSKMKKWHKKQANKSVRQNEESYNHGSYRKQYDIKWNID